MSKDFVDVNVGQKRKKAEDHSQDTFAYSFPDMCPFPNKGFNELSIQESEEWYRKHIDKMIALGGRVLPIEPFIWECDPWPVHRVKNKRKCSRRSIRKR